MDIDFDGKLTITEEIDNKVDKNVKLIQNVKPSQNAKPDKIVKIGKKGLDLSPQGIINGVIFSELISAPRYRKGYKYIRRRRAD